MKIICECCENSEFISLGNHPDFEKSSVLCCKRCEFLKTNPLPKDSELKFFYQEDYGVTRQMGNIDPHFYDLRAKSQMEFIMNSICSNANNFQLDNIHLLEIGCGPASLLSLFDEITVSGVGYEPDPIIFKLANEKKLKNIKLINSIFSPTESMQNSFDIIILSHVLEHISHPSEYMELLFSLLKDDGIIFLEIPNMNKKLGEQFVKRRKKRTGHLYFWNSINIRQFVERISGTIVELQTTGQRKNDYYFSYSEILTNMENIENFLITNMHSKKVKIKKIFQKIPIISKYLETIYEGIIIRVIIKKKIM